jgi:hypothetical protein
VCRDFGGGQIWCQDILVPDGQCGDQEEVPCYGVINCVSDGWVYEPEEPCGSNEFDCRENGGDWIEPGTGEECCGTCVLP